MFEHLFYIIEHKLIIKLITHFETNLQDESIKSN